MFDFVFTPVVKALPKAKAKGRTKKEIHQIAVARRNELAARKEARKEHYYIPAAAPVWTPPTPEIIIESIFCECCSGTVRTATMFYKSTSVKDPTSVRWQRADVAKRPADVALAEVSHKPTMHVPFCADCVEAAQEMRKFYESKNLPRRQRELFEDTLL